MCNQNPDVNLHPDEPVQYLRAVEWRFRNIVGADRQRNKMIKAQTEIDEIKAEMTVRNEA